MPQLRLGQFLMSNLFTRIDLAKLQSLAEDTAPTYHHLSDITRQLCLDMLTRFPSYRWSWRNDGDELTDEEWDIAQALVDQASQELIKTMLIGTILEWPLDFLPGGFEWCDGGEISRESDLGELLVVAGCPYGVGDGLTTVNKPDRRGRVAVGVDTGQAEFDTLGETGGEKTHTLTTGEMPAHSHPHSHSEITASPVFINGGLEAPAPASLPGIGATGSDSTSAGGGEAHNNLQPYLAVNYIIKT